MNNSLCQVKSSSASVQGYRGGSLHYPLTFELAQHIRQLDLTAAEWRIWSYLVTVDPFGDRYEEMELATLLKECRVSKPTFYRAMAKFEECALFDTKTAQIAVKNLQGARKILSENSLKNETPVSNLRNQSQKRDESFKNETEFSEMKLQSQKRENRPPEPLQEEDSGSPQTIHTDQTDQTLSESPPPTPDEGEVLEFVIKEVRQDKTIRQVRPYAKKCLKEDREFWFNKFLERQKKQAVTYFSAPPPSTDFEAESFEQRCDRYLRQWTSDPVLRNGIKNAVAAYPELGLEVVGDELRRVKP
ncbi:MAG: hypothetical protein HC936_00125 [Leptolyngbyaceae cyanobacterium SU_3_3]|nr:hypothetical protein [Leptolyngbyaceae cyanobacterium SU_3_3]NJR52620.1 hypothetical protein [Leptolyngbyaceae cyanobacterium CSU_1_3]